MRLVFWRHGQTDQNLKRRIQGAHDYPLNTTGHEQAAAAAAQLKLFDPTHIISSPLIRARQTAQYLSNETGLEPSSDARLRERAYGQWEGLTAAEIEKDFPEQFKLWRSGHDPEGVGVESRRDTGARFAAGVLDAVEKFRDGDAGADQTLVFVTHGGAITAGTVTLLGLDPLEWSGLRGLDNCRWAILEPRRGTHPRWRLRTYNAYTADLGSGI